MKGERIKNRRQNLTHLLTVDCMKSPTVFVSLNLAAPFYTCPPLLYKEAVEVKLQEGTGGTKHPSLVCANLSHLVSFSLILNPNSSTQFFVFP